MKNCGRSKAQHQFQLFLGGMTRNMDIRDGLVKHFRSLAEQVVDRAIDHFFVAGNGCRRKNNGITGLDTNQCDDPGWQCA